MIINKDSYECPKCKEIYRFETGKPYSTICPKCHVEMTFWFNGDFDTELAEAAKKRPPYDPTKDPASPFYIPIITCPTCRSQ